MITRRYFVSGLTSLAALAGLRVPKLGAPFPGLRLYALDPLARAMLNAGTPIRVFVDGQELKLCTGFDSREGWAEFFKDANSKPLKTSRIYGTITTEPPLAELARQLHQI